MIVSTTILSWCTLTMALVLFRLNLELLLLTVVSISIWKHNAGDILYPDLDYVLQVLLVVTGAVQEGEGVPGGGGSVDK